MNEKKATDYKCHNDCGKMAVEWFPRYDQSVVSHPYCERCLKKVKRELIKSITDGRNN